MHRPSRGRDCRVSPCLLIDLKYVENITGEYNTSVKYRAIKTKAGREVRFNPLPGVLVLFVGLVPLVVSFGGYDKFRLPKEVASALFVAVACGALLAFYRLNWRPRLKSWETLMGAGFIYVLAHSVIVGNVSLALPQLILLGSFAIMGVIAFLVSRRELQELCWLVAAVVLSINAVLTVLQFYGLIPQIAGPAGETLSGRLNPAGLIGDVNSGGFLFALICIPLIYHVIVSKTTRKRAFAVGLILINLLGLAFTQTLTAILSLGICLVVWLAYHHLWTLKTQDSAGRSLLTLWLVVVAAVGCAVIVSSQSGLTGRLENIAGMVKRGDWSAATSGREPVYRITLAMIQDHPWTGSGLGSFPAEFFHFRSERPLGQSAKLINQPGAFQQAHNEFLQVWDELGLPGLLFFICLLLGPPLLALPSAFQWSEPRRSYWTFTLILAVLFTLLECFSFFPFHLSVTAVFIVFTLAGLRHTALFVSGFLPVQPRSLKPLLPALPWCLAGLLVAVMPSYFALKQWRANNEMEIASFLLTQATTGRYNLRQRRLFAERALDGLNRAEELCAHCVEAYNLQGTALMVLGRNEEAVLRYRKAVQRIPSPEVYTNLAAAYLALKEYTQARHMAEVALRYNPQYSRAQQALDYIERQ